MNKFKSFVLFLTIAFNFKAAAQQTEEWKNYTTIIRKNIFKDYRGMYKPAGGALLYPFLTPGSSQYSDVLWDWDSWLSNVALRQIILENNDEKAKKEAIKYEQGCVLNFLSFSSIDGWIPIYVNRSAKLENIKPKNIYQENMHKPCLAQHAAFLVKANNGNAEWLREHFYFLQTFVDNYINHHQNRETGLYYWQNDNAIGVDNDPSTYYRPNRSSGSIFLNTMMYKELKAMVYLAKQLNLNEVSENFEKDSKKLHSAILEHCWDERDGFFYSVDLNLKPIHQDSAWTKHSGSPRDWDCLIQRLGVWSGFMVMWAEIATPEQAKRIVEENYKNPKTFNAPSGVRTLSKLEKMYNVKASGNPSSWLGPVWGISNYLVWKGLIKYGYTEEAKELAAKTIVMFGKDFQKYGVLHEYYQPENGEPILNPGFQNWNYLVLNMLAWMEGKEVIEEF